MEVERVEAAIAEIETQPQAMEAVQQEQVGDELVARQRLGKRAVIVLGDVSDNPRQAVAVEVEQPLDQVQSGLARRRVAEALDLLQQRLDALRGGGAHPCSPNIGECTCLIVFPFPRYMCTPHGRHGSKERTARMMSIPRKFSASASSKIGMPLQASS